MDDDTPVKKSNNFVKFCLILLILTVIGSAIALSVYSIAPKTHSTPPVEALKVTPKPNLYKQLSKDILARQKSLNKRYLASRTPNQRKKIIQEARELLETEMPKMMRYWIGTPWDFNGTSQTPGKGKIACGYFVSVILRDVGFKINRVSLAQQASGNIIRSFVKKRDYKVYRSGIDYDLFVSQFKEQPKGIYIVGLDTHVGYLLNLDSKIHFIHSGSTGVVDQEKDYARDLEVSRWHSTGNITRHDYIIEKWLKGERIETKKK